MSAFDLEYYKRRFVEEMELAAEAEDAAIAAIHEELAGLYKKMITALEGPETETA